MAKIHDRLAAARAYIDNVIEQDFGRPRSELMPLMLMVAGPIPPPKPFSGMSQWKYRAQQALLQVAMDGDGYRYAKSYVQIVVLYLCRIEAGIALSGIRPVQGWELSYMNQIRSSRRIVTNTTGEELW